MTPEVWKKEKLDPVSCSFCVAKWKQVTLHLHTGQTHSCHHPVPHKIPVEELEGNPSALHNTKFKKLQRKQMLEGDRPKECDYCWRVEDNNEISDRTYKSKEPWAESYIPEIIQKPWDDNVNPSYLEVSFSSVCNFKCSYCSPQVSSKWMEEVQKHGPYPTTTAHGGIDWLKDQGVMPIPNKDYNPYVEAFWKWWPDVSKDLKHFRITGGEPLLSKDTFRVLDDLIENPRPDLEFAVNSNMCVPDGVFNRFMEKIKIICGEGKVKKFKIFTSAEATGAQAEYIRHGLDYNKWLDNINRVLTEVPNCTFTNMATYNFLSLFSFKDLIKDILEIKDTYGGWQAKHMPIILDVPYLRHPGYQAVDIMPAKFRSYIYDQVSLVYDNIENNGWYESANRKFFNWEAEKFRRIYEITTYIDEEHETKPHVINHRKNLIRFVDEHDRRRGTNFLKTFPEMEEEYRKWKATI
jgi:organic radical activating enzyme